MKNKRPVARQKHLNQEGSQTGSAAAVLSGLVRADTPETNVALELDADGDSNLDGAVPEHTEQVAAATKCQGRGITAAGCQRQGSMGLNRAETLSSGYTLQQKDVFAPRGESGRQRTVTTSCPKEEARSGQLGLAGERGWPPMHVGSKGQPSACANAAQRACTLVSQAADLSGMQQVRITWKSPAACVMMHAHLQFACIPISTVVWCSRVQQIWESAPQAQRHACRSCRRCLYHSNTAFR